ncbi:pentapeptide repeat-containing protein [Streptomyces marincola]|uniref:pentapeptide repeat-containing protein n=1 Tax=Streptomyces marincola TaxID=2878388 RepID=UPI001CF4E621|nr:pentapeptide repeat-containing protein [Streptomyces marincola]UCM87913.1 pentapeptide repeat-containing protein [Streptomyces marincola]
MTDEPSAASGGPLVPWPHCGHGATADDRVGCRGVRIAGRAACLVHVDEAERAAYLGGLAPGADVDHRGTSFDSRLLDRLLAALRDPATGRSRLGAAQFQEASFAGDVQFARAVFSGEARFYGASFGGDAQFERAAFSGAAGFDRVAFVGRAGFDQATFTGDAGFHGTTFAGAAGFERATFTGEAGFHGAAFSGEARFDQAVFGSDAGFYGAAFRGEAGFHRAEFAGDAQFERVEFAGDAGFRWARFEAAPRLGPLTCAGTVELSGAVFGAPVTVEVAAGALALRRTRFASTAALRARYARVDLSGAVLEYPVSLAAEPQPFTDDSGGEVADRTRGDADAGVRVLSLNGVDTSHLSLTDVDMAECRLAGAVNLDQLSLSGRVTFARPPVGWHRRGVLPARWSHRKVLVEEHHFRAAGHRGPAARGWRPDPDRQDASPAPDLRAVVVAGLYRQLRKALEDGKNEPGAADFYYGEMEMRRRDRGTPFPERLLLRLYWATSGYGLRASRALAWLGAAMTATVLALMLWGLPADEPKPSVTGRQVEAGQELALVTDTPPPVNPGGPPGDRLTAERFEKALRVVINSGVFRSSGQHLTTAGTYTEMAARFSAPLLLALAVLAVRARVKR